VEVLCEGLSKTNSARLVGRTRTNKIVVFEGDNELIGELVDVQIERANGFSLYGTPLKVAHASGSPPWDRKPEACATLAMF
jgi:tRNA-2-methylthio-N6-dimethylallyladenosine synthase